MENTQQQVSQEGNLNQNPTSANPIANQKGNVLLIIGVVVLVLVIGAGGYFLYQKQAKPIEIPPKATPLAIPQSTPVIDETANWKIYTNSTYGFQLKSLNGMSESSKGKGVLEVEGGLQIIYSVINLSSDKENIKKNWTNVPGFPEPQTLKTLVDAYLNSNTNTEILLSYEKLSAFLLCKESDSCPRVENQQTSTINGYQALQYSYDFKDHGNQARTQTNISILVDGKIYRFWTVHQKELFVKIINSFNITQ